MRLLERIQDVSDVSVHSGSGAETTFNGFVVVTMHDFGLHCDFQVHPCHIDSKGVRPKQTSGRTGVMDVK